MVVEKKHFESMEKIQNSFTNLQQKHDQLQATLSERDDTIVNFENKNEEWLKEKEQMQRELANKTQKLEENERVIAELTQTIQKMKTELAARPTLIDASNVIIALSPDHFRVSGSTVTTIDSSEWAACFTKPVSKGIHRLSIRTEAEYVMIGVLDAAVSPNYLTKDVSESPTAAMMHNNDGSLWSANKRIAYNAQPEKGQEWSAEADLEKRTLHFFVDGVQQPHHFTNIPVPLVFALETYYKDESIDITFWGELEKSSVMFEGTGHNLG
ncbi:hypothetical protein BLNAU_17776 [Blattamonas nauphoetae]|uniref:Uncharacterized protein n=1 Tax=Blattamonas nauphoetae TaxID=2049346 RepID=A0ABQ9X6A0_9EUKA|nr:hypothetical protein BLNAU_17776 [Blattamonas nauphoetae]